jgi:tRNA (cmo5U34)-methyltransferase
MSNPTQEIFDITAATYDADRAKLIPCYDAFYRRTTDLIVGGAERVLDLGAGTGLLSTFVRTWYPKAHIHLMDVSEPMLERARTRLGADSNVSFEVADYATAKLPENQDSIVSALSIHHLDNEAKKALFKKIYASLRPGGTFVNAEQVAGPTPALDAHYKVIWLQQVREAGATPQQIADRTTAAPPSKTSSTGCARPALPTPTAGSRTIGLLCCREPAPRKITREDRASFADTLSPKGATLYQPRAKPWVRDQ